MMSDERNGQGGCGRLDRFFVDGGAVCGDEVFLGDEQGRQVCVVLRLGVGGRIVVLDNSGAEYDVELTTVSPAEVRGRIVGRREGVGEAGVGVCLYQSLLSRSKFEWVLQKCTEVGASRFVPVVTQRSIVRGAEAIEARRLERWRRIISEAAEQSARAKLPELAAAIKFDEAIGRLSGFGCSLIASTEQGASGLEQVLGEFAARPSEVALLVGPEGGFTADELGAARDAGARAFSLGPRILRTETAAVVASALVLHELGEMGG